MLTVGDVADIMEKLFPLELAEDWDNVGLQLGRRNDRVNRIGVVLELTSANIDDVLGHDVDMVVTHHPLIFRPLKCIDADTPGGRMICKLIRSRVSVYTAHTNLDNARPGLADWFAERIGLVERHPVEPKPQRYYKLVVFVPMGHEASVMDALARAGAGHIGNYSHCTYRTAGKGTFKPLAGTDPYVGSQGELTEVDEYRLETIVPSRRLADALEEMKKVHPYEEIAYDIYPLELHDESAGTGRWGDLKGPEPVQEICERAKERLDIPRLTVYGDVHRSVSRIAVIPGSGGSMFKAVAGRGCQMLLTGEIKYHDMLEAVQLGLTVAAAGHGCSEMIMVSRVSEFISQQVRILDDKVEIACLDDRRPWPNVNGTII